jgi:hypothetical protein
MKASRRTRILHGLMVFVVQGLLIIVAAEPAHLSRWILLNGLPPRPRASKEPHQARYANGLVPGPLWPAKPTRGC